MTDEAEYPKIVAITNGFEVILNSRVKLPGWFTSFNQAERAIGRYQGRATEAKLKNKGK